MKNREILIVTEGPDDAKAMRKILRAYGISANHNIYEYATNIYCLYDVLEEEMDGDWEQVDIPLLLKSRETNEEKKEMLSKKFTEIILIFDFDPQHTTYEYGKIERLMQFFNDAEVHGKLYVDYPMVEAMEHFISFPNDASYKNRIVTKDMLANHEYKEEVHLDASPVRRAIDFKTKGAIDNVIAMNLMKAKYILTGEYSRVSSIDEYRAIDCEKILKEQAEMYAKIEQFYVLCTCVFYVLDFDYTKYFVS